MIPITKPWMDERESDAVARVLASGWITQGPKVEQFERTVAEYVGSRHAVAVSSCTTALDLALTVLGIGPGDEVLCPSMSFIASANAVRHVGADPVFVDVDPRTFNLDPGAVEAAIGERTRAVLVVHQLGMPADLDALRAITKPRGVPILEDAACAIGSRYRGRAVGGHGRMACFSFHPRKVITTGEGGMITTDSDEEAERLRLLRQHGMSVPDRVRHTAKEVITEEYLCLGYNFRMTDIQAALGIEQMKRLETILDRRRRLAGRYAEALTEHPWLDPPYVPDYAESNFQSYAITLRAEAPVTRDAVMRHLLEQGIASRRGVMLTHLEPAYRDVALRHPLPHSESASAASLLVPLYPTMEDEELERVIGQLFAPALLQAKAAASHR